MATRVRLTIAGIAAGLVITMWGCTELSDEHRVHPGNWGTEHQAKVRTVNYDFTFCQSCHGDDLEGDAETPGCSGSECHKVGAGQSALDAIYACDNCHGYIDSDPFADVVGNTSEDSLTIGMHTSHILARHSLTVPLDCSTCHVLPDSVFAAGHLEDSDSDVTFDSLATADKTLNTAWDPNTASCSQVYCHGTFTFGSVTGNDATWTWTDTFSGENLCATCHGYPPTGHVQNYVLCGTCHGSVVSDEDHRTIINPAKHINGLKN